MGSMSAAAVAAGAGSRRGSRRGSRGAANEHQTANNSSSRYVSVSVRILDGDSGCWADVWRWLESYCRPGWTPWILGAVLAAALAAASLVDWLRFYAQLCSLIVPFFAVMSGYLLLALGFRHSWTPTGIYLTFCGSVVGETVGFFLSTALLDATRLNSFQHGQVGAPAQSVSPIAPYGQCVV